MSEYSVSNALARIRAKVLALFAPLPKPRNPQIYVWEGDEHDDPHQPPRWEDITDN